MSTVYPKKTLSSNNVGYMYWTSSGKDGLSGVSGSWIRKTIPVFHHPIFLRHPKNVRSADTDISTVPVIPRLMGSMTPYPKAAMQMSVHADKVRR